MACVDTKRLRCSATPVEPLSKVLDDDNLVEEILLRLPSKPSSLPRASLVCKRWRGILSDPEFLKRFRRHHRKPPLLGFFLGTSGMKHNFLPLVVTKPDRIPTKRFAMPNNTSPYDQWDFRGCRHGLVVLTHDCRREAVVWDPLTGQQHRMPFPPGLRNADSDKLWYWHAAVLCVDAEDGHVHGDCFSSSFKLALICSGDTEASACLYESATGVWGNIVSVVTTSTLLPIRPSILIGNVVYWCLRRGEILAFDIERQTIVVIEKPTYPHATNYWSFHLLRTDDSSGLGLAVISELTIELWERKMNFNGVVGWVLLQKTIQLEKIFPPEMPWDNKWAHFVGYDEDTNTIILCTKIGKFMLQLNSMHTRKIFETNVDYYMEFYPYRNFYTAGSVVGWKWLDLKL